MAATDTVADHADLVELGAVLPLRSPLPGVLPAVREGVSDAGAGEEWEKSVSMLVEAVESDVEDAEMLLATALNWKGWAVCSPTMRRFMKWVGGCIGR